MSCTLSGPDFYHFLKFGHGFSLGPRLLFDWTKRSNFHRNSARIYFIEKHLQAKFLTRLKFDEKGQIDCFNY